MKTHGMLICLMLYSQISFAKKDNDRDTRIVGNYKVTIEESTDELKDANNFPVTYKVRKKNGVIQKISYDLPKELDGAGTDIEFSPSVEDPTVWVGNHSESVCKIQAGQFDCAMKYKNLIMDAAVAETKIDAAVKPGPANDAKKDIMRHFQTFAMGNEPIGHVKFELP